MELLRIDLTGQPHRATPDSGLEASTPGLLGVDVTGRDVDGVAHTVVQVLFDDDTPGFDATLLDAPMLADVVDRDGSVVARELLDHDRFRRQLRAERDLGRSNLRGVLVLTGGSLPPPWVRLAFLPLDVGSCAERQLVLHRSSVPELVAGVEAAHAAAELTDSERLNALTSIEQRHPDWN